MASKVESISKACKVNDEIFSLILENIKNNSLKTEKDVDKFIRREARKRKLKIAFPPVVAIGKNAAEIHHKPKKTRLKKGFLVMDFGVKVNGYCSDMTRTVYIGKASKKEKEVYAKLLSVQKSAVNKVKQGAECFEIDCFARKKLGNLREYFTHSLGHGLGKKIHEKPNLSPKTSEKLKKNDAVTVEPGIYIKGKLGIRIEDSVLAGKKPVMLTKSTKKLIELK
jgi:Xaa-Pro aminopeptidase